MKYLFYLSIILILLNNRSNIMQLYRSYSQSKCLIPLPDILQNALVPANDCNFCINLTRIDRVHSINPEIFSQRYAYTKVPVVITDAMVNWSAPHVFNFDFFKRLYHDHHDHRKRKNCQFFPYRTEFRSLDEVFEMHPLRSNYTPGTKPWYIGWSNCDYRIANEIRSHYTKPYFLPANSESIRTDWIFMGTPDCGAHMHIDHVGRPSWQAQIKGTKRWFLEPPLECYPECLDLTIDVKQGDIIVLDTNIWYHKTLIIGDKISLTIGAEYD
uniref:Bifunctional arginine demethylase and lysyl-hydroxylase psr-1-like n=1 Tax=Dermatophagoides pteronyssinus TaxID=6956 RepID=A0A6P6YG59_DERPT|nr:bifunctional arginine demethylase and lysyl-hydroxylase psr-1-like [Dermatophagoides pteronyssinus]